MKISPIKSQICQIRYKKSKNCKRLVNFCQSGEISPNLVTLILVHLVLRILHSTPTPCVFFSWDENEKLGYLARDYFEMFILPMEIFNGTPHREIANSDDFEYLHK